MIKLDEGKCVNCNACIRVCPVMDANSQKFIPETGKHVIEVNQDACIKCRACIRECHHNARSFTDDTDEFMKSLLSGKRIAIIVAPAIKIAFDGYWRHVLQYFRLKGVLKIYDVSFGAEICTWAHLRYLQKNPNEKLISQPCAAIANYVQKYAKQLIPHFSPVHSPMLCTAVYMRQTLGSDFEIAALSPCIAKQDEFRQTGIVKYNVTFQKLREYFNKHKIDVKSAKISSSEFSHFEFDKMQGMMGSIYSEPGGLRDNLRFHAPGINVINCEGTEIVYQALDDYKKEPFDYLPDVFDVLSCEHGCNGGPAVGQEYSAFHIKRIMNNVEYFVKKREKKYSSVSGSKLFKEFDRKLKLSDFTRAYSTSCQPLPEPSENEILKAFAKLNKTNPENQNYNCRACGYKTCRDMAVSIAKGINNPESCMQYKAYIAEKQSENIKLLFDDIRKLSGNLRDITDSLNCSIENVNGSSHMISAVSRQSVSDLDELYIKTNLLENKFRDVVTELLHINAVVEDYAKMSDAVNTIARQINILSINASVEAAHAGELGKGFAVVAEEVRTLAGHSRASVREADVCNNNINKSITSITDIVNNVNSIMRELAASLQTAKNTTAKAIDSSKEIENYMSGVSNQCGFISDLVAQTNNLISKISSENN